MTGIAWSDRCRVQIFQGARGSDLQTDRRQRRAQDAISHSQRVFAFAKLHHKRSRLLGPWVDAKICGCDQPQAAVASDQQLHQVVSGNVFYHPPAGFRLFAIATHETDPDAEVPHRGRALHRALQRTRK